MPRESPPPYAVPEGHGARNENERLLVVANARAGGGRAGRARDEIARAVDRAFAQARIVWTEGPGHATEIARQGCTDVDIVAALGGDGTCHEVVNGLLAGGRAVNPRVIFATLPFGTGGDLVRSLAVPGGLGDALWIAATGTTLPLDAGLARWASGEERVFINVLGAGANAEVCRRANRSSKRFGGTATFLSATVGALLSYVPRRARWRWRGPAGDGELEMETLAAFCANGHYCGAGMHVGKGGSMADGWLDVTLIPRIGLSTALPGVRHLYAGSLDRIEGARRFTASEVEIDGDIPIETDGEPREDGPVRVVVLPRALHVRGGWLRPPTGGLAEF